MISDCFAAAERELALHILSRVGEALERLGLTNVGILLFEAVTWILNELKLIVVFAGFVQESLKIVFVVTVINGLTEVTQRQP